MDNNRTTNKNKYIFLFGEKMKCIICKGELNMDAEMCAVCIKENGI